MSTDLDNLTRHHIASCALCTGEPLFTAIDQGGALRDVAVMGRAVLITHLHPEDPTADAVGDALKAIKRAVAQDIAKADRGEPTDIWTITDQAGQEIGRVWGDTWETASDFAKRLPEVKAVIRAESRIRLRRLGANELHQAAPATPARPKRRHRR